MSRSSHEKLNRNARLQASERKARDAVIQEATITKPWRNKKSRRTRRKSTGPKETIEEFLARGGVIKQVTYEES